MHGVNHKTWRGRAAIKTAYSGLRIPSSTWFLSRNPLFRSRPLAIVDVDVNVDVYVDRQAYDNHFAAKYLAGCTRTMKHLLARPRPRRYKWSFATETT